MRIFWLEFPCSPMSALNLRSITLPIFMHMNYCTVHEHYSLLVYYLHATTYCVCINEWQLLLLIITAVMNLYVLALLVPVVHTQLFIICLCQSCMHVQRFCITIYFNCSENFKLSFLCLVSSLIYFH